MHRTGATPCDCRIIRFIGTLFFYAGVLGIATQLTVRRDVDRTQIDYVPIAMVRIWAIGVAWFVAFWGFFFTGL